MTTISFELPNDGFVRIALFAIDGRLIKELASGRYLAGSHELLWRGIDESGRRVASGTYFCQMDSGEFRKIVKMVLAK